MAHNKISHRKIWQFVWPVLLGNLSIPLLGLVDTALLGHLSDPIYLGAVAIGSSVVTMMLWVFGFFKMGVTSLVSQAKGKQDEALQLRLGMQALAAAIVLGLIISVIAPFLLSPIFRWMAVDQSLIGLAQEYAHIRLLAAPFVLGSYVVTGWLLAQQHTKSVLILLLLLNLGNIVADYLFIWQFGWASEGAAWATLGAEVLVFFAGVFLVVRAFTLNQWALLQTVHLNQLLRVDQDSFTLFTVNGALFVRTLCLLSVLLWFWRSSASLGDSTLAINALLMQLVGLSAFVLDAFAHCAEALTGEAMGRRDRQELKAVLRKTLLWVSVSAVLLSVTFYLTGHRLLWLLSDIPQVIELSEAFVIWIAIIPMVSFLAYHFDGVCLGMGKIRAMLLSVVFGAVFGFVPAWHWVGGETNHQLWLALLLFNALRSLYLSLYMSFLFLFKPSEYVLEKR